MPKAENNKLIRRRLVNAYVSSIISISLVLLLIGIASTLVVNAGSVTRYFKESMQISVLLKQESSDADAVDVAGKLEKLPYVKTVSVVTREQGTEELKSMLGDDFLSVFESSPVPVSVDVSLVSEYVSADSLAVVIPVLQSIPLVDEVSCQESLVDALNANLTRISAVLGVFVVLLLFISYVLINNTVRLSVFSRRFTIHTMKLVGATKAYICKPFIIGSIWQGTLASLIAICALSGILIALRNSFPALFGILRTELLVAVMGIVLVCGVLICVMSTWIVVNKLVGWTRDELYY